jgi:hypothetical protein
VTAYANSVTLSVAALPRDVVDPAGQVRDPNRVMSRELRVRRQGGRPASPGRLRPSHSKKFRWHQPPCLDRTRTSRLALYSPRHPSVGIPRRSGGMLERVAGNGPPCACRIRSCRRRKSRRKDDKRCGRTASPGSCRPPQSSISRHNPGRDECIRPSWRHRFRSGRRCTMLTQNARLNARCVFFREPRLTSLYGNSGTRSHHAAFARCVPARTADVFL